MNGDPQTPLLLKAKGGGESGGGSPKSWTAKDRCRPRYERLIMVLTDKLLSETGWELSGFLGRSSSTLLVCLGLTVGAKLLLGLVTACMFKDRKENSVRHLRGICKAADRTPQTRAMSDRTRSGTSRRSGGLLGSAKVLDVLANSATPDTGPGPSG